jgi:hypothetical protein
MQIMSHFYKEKNPGDLENGHEFFVGTSTLNKAAEPTK